MITGHSDVTTWSAFVEYGEFNRRSSAAQQAVRSGKTPRTRRGAQAARKFKDYKMGGAKDNVTKIYAELKK